MGFGSCLKDAEARYYWEGGGIVSAVDPCEPNLERAVFLILAELAKVQSSSLRNVQTFGRSLTQEGEPLMDFRTVTTEERQKLITALRGNAEDNLAILMDRRDTSFVGSRSSEEISDDEVISAIQSVPCHY